MVHPGKIPSLLFAAEDGQIIDFPELEMSGMSNLSFHKPAIEDLIPLPEGSELFTLPGRLPVGWDPIAREPALLAEDPFSEGKGVQAVAAFIAPAHTSLYCAGFQSQKNCPTLPLFAYTAVGWHDNQFWVCAFRSDQDKRQDTDQYDQSVVIKKTQAKLKFYSQNRLVQHLGKCCMTYGCPAARNYFLDRWEAPLPTSPTCNARCLGCISLQESGCCPSTQDRISFIPTVEEISELATAHLIKNKKPIVSFGQGCEGEPLMQTETIEKAIVAIRKQTQRGTINLNTNASLPKQVAKLAEAGLDSMRVSLNSAQEQFYKSYYRPKNYSFRDVTRSIDEMKERNRFVSLNYFILPGFTDTEPEYEGLATLISNHHPDFIQLRNLNMDPEWYLNSIDFPKETKAITIRKWHKRLKADFPALGFGYFNPQVN